MQININSSHLWCWRSQFLTLIWPSADKVLSIHLGLNCKIFHFLSEYRTGSLWNIVALHHWVNCANISTLSAEILLYPELIPRNFLHLLGSSLSYHERHIKNRNKCLQQNIDNSWILVEKAALSILKKWESRSVKSQGN